MSEKKQQHIVMLPFMAKGHLIPFLNLARFIEKLKPYCSISIATTPLNIQSLRSSVPSTSSIHFAPLPFSPTDHGLPPDTENSSSISHIDSLPLLMFASETLAPDFDKLLSDLTTLHRSPPLLIIADAFAGWSLPIARNRGIPYFAFTTSGGFGTAAFTSLWLHLPHRLTDSDTFHVPGFPDHFRLDRSQMSHYMSAADGSDDWSVFLRRQINLYLKSDALLCNTVEEIEPTGVHLLRRITGLHVLTVGIGREVGMEVDPCIEWLESHRPASVLYISFGSQNTIGASQMMALAEGLEASGLAFIWVVRPPLGFDMNGEFEADRWLPDGFEARMAEKRRGLVVRRWAPQIGILSHKATGGFMSHCGWNSVMESLSRGVPVIGWPVSSEQFYNSMMMVAEMRVGMEMARGAMGEVNAKKVERVVRMVMEGEKGNAMRNRAARCGEMIRSAMEEEGKKKGSSVRAIDEVFELAMRKSLEMN
ncbi:crocetin glucosyltransferase 3 [Dendrobium catenatum]|uniref:Glycosyltransferase n=1 Tax=Dendrobium catenatum TaxID=906689 RepID=A0A2I0VTV2_9ASPA|nr:crocetin glucosyltransferase 3 [Dendrobium catenatum]PKU66835.1 Crocetin glucosyltransferase 3 [Dendrobium catenatum]